MIKIIKIKKYESYKISPPLNITFQNVFGH